MSDRNARVPKLRFPDFRDAGAWEECKLGNCLSRHPEYGINAPAVPYYANLPTYLRITDISEEGHFLQNKKVSVARKVNEENYLCEGDIALARTGASVGKSYKYKKIDGELVFAGFLIRVRPDEEKLNSELLFQFLSTEQYWRWVDFSSARSGQPGINGNEYASLPVPLPPNLEEQQKIANCLTSVDDLITAQAQKLDGLKAHKKGLMQQLFPAEGETIPRLRFPEFQDAGAWEESLLGPNTTKIGSGITPRGGEKTYKKSGRPFVRSQNIGWGHLLLDDVAFIDEKTHSTFAATEIKENDVFLNISGASIGRSAIANDRVTGGNVNQHVCIIRVKPSDLNAIFLNQYLNSAYGQNQIDSFQAGGNRQGLNFGQIRALSVPMPKEKEQQKIAACLSSIDDLIAASTQKHDALKAHKKGLMQQLFPAADEKI